MSKTFPLCKRHGQMALERTSISKERSPHYQNLYAYAKVRNCTDRGGGPNWEDEVTEEKERKEAPQEFSRLR